MEKSQRTALNLVPSEFELTLDVCVRRRCETGRSSDSYCTMCGVRYLRLRHLASSARADTSLKVQVVSVSWRKKERALTL
jgi:hypothetical protein